MNVPYYQVKWWLKNEDKPTKTHSFPSFEEWEKEREKSQRVSLKKNLALVEEMADWRDIREVQLTCAAGNERALEFFRRQGFVVSDPDHGRYSSGQPAVRMSRPYP